MSKFNSYELATTLDLNTFPGVLSQVFENEYVHLNIEFSERILNTDFPVVVQ